MDCYFGEADYGGLIVIGSVGTFPVGTILSLVGPYGYLFHNSFGTGLTVEEKIAELAGSDVSITFENPSTDDDDFDKKTKK